MAKRPSKTRGNGARRARAPRAPVLTPEIRRDIAVVLLFALGVVGALAFAGIAGSAGGAISNALRALFGLAAFLVPVVCLILATILVRVDRPPFTAVHVLGLFLLAVAITGLLHVRLGSDVLPALPAIAEGGGYLGLILAVPLRQLFGGIAAAIILACVSVIGVFLSFQLSFDHLRAIVRVIRNTIRSIRMAMLAARYRRQSKEPAEPETNFAARELDQPEEDTNTEASPNGTTDTQVSDLSAQGGSASGGKSQVSSLASDAIVAEARQKRRRRPRVELPLDLLSNEAGKPMSGDIRVCQEIIRKTLEQFSISVEMGEVSVGPTVTQYTLRPAEGVKLARITALHNDLALALAAHPIRIEAPIPGKSLVGIEVPNQKVAVVRLREILESEPFRKRASNITIALGKDVAGSVWTADIARMPHLLVAGSTGSGKSVMLNTIIVSLLYQNGPDDLRLLLIDPKRVEFPVYNGIPHLLTPVITDVKKTVAALKWAIAEMDRRFELLASVQKRDIASYNTTRTDSGDRLPYLVIIIDELADLMAVAAVEVESSIIRLAQMARAVGIHLIVATQRPSVDVLTGLIKANITSRIAFAVASSIDSRTILDQVGAERLLGRGDMLFVSAELSKPKRIQGAFVGDAEISRVVGKLHEQGGDTTDALDLDAQPLVVLRNGDDDGEDDDPMLPEAKEVLIAAGKGSASLLQRRLKIGYARAARILDILERQGFIGPADGAKPREVYGSEPTVDNRQSTVDDDVAPAEEERDTV